MLARIDGWREASRLMDPGALVVSVLDETGFGTYVSALYGGEARRGNLELIAELAKRFSANGGSLGGFIRYFDGARESTKEPGASASGADAVRLMTIHSSKGLEFPVVILGDVTKKFRRTYNTDVGIFDADLGIGLCSVSGDKEHRSLLQRAIASREATRLNAEEMRLLYVAATRAREKLIMLGAKPKAREYAEKLARPLDDVRIMNADYYIDWIVGAFFPNGIDTPAALPCGRRIELSVEPPSLYAGERRGMSADDFAAWQQEAAFVDPSRLDALFSFRYPSEEDSRLPSKLSVTGLTLSPAEVSVRPRFMEEGRALTAADVGTLTHRLLQLVSIAPHTEESVKAELERLTERGLFTSSEAAVIDVGAIARFFSSDPGKRLVSSRRVEREMEFNLIMEAKKLTDTGSDAPVMLQGVIDCCFMEDGGWVLIDHKTSHVGPGRTAKAVAAKYARQLELYAEALTRLTGTPVKEKFVYLLSCGEAVRLP